MWMLSKEGHSCNKANQFLDYKDHHAKLTENHLMVSRTKSSIISQNKKCVIVNE